MRYLTLVSSLILVHSYSSVTSIHAKQFEACLHGVLLHCRPFRRMSCLEVRRGERAVVGGDTLPNSKVRLLVCRFQIAYRGLACGGVERERRFSSSRQIAIRSLSPSPSPRTLLLLPANRYSLPLLPRAFPAHDAF